MNQRRSFIERMASIADLNTEPIPGMPLVEVVGQTRVLIENHNGVIQYGCNEICVKVSYGHIRICGVGLELCKMTKDQLVIMGTIEGVQLCGRRK